MKSLTNIFNILFKDKLPEKWMLSLLVPIFERKEVPLYPNSYRGLMLLKHVFKLYEKILDRSLRWGGWYWYNAAWVYSRERDCWCCVCSEETYSKNSKPKLSCFFIFVTWKRLLIEWQGKLFAFLWGERVYRNIW